MTHCPELEISFSDNVISASLGFSCVHSIYYQGRQSCQILLCQDIDKAWLFLPYFAIIACNSMHKED